MDMTRTWNQNLWDAQRRLDETRSRIAAPSGSGASSPASPGRPSSSGLATRQYPITTTDFRPTATRLVPDEIAATTPGLTSEQREDLRRLYHQFLTAFENEARKYNVANSFAFVVAASLQERWQHWS
jgi:hypothetical protein